MCRSSDAKAPQPVEPLAAPLQDLMVIQGRSRQKAKALCQKTQICPNAPHFPSHGSFFGAIPVPSQVIPCSFPGQANSANYAKYSRDVRGCQLGTGPKSTFSVRISPIVIYSSGEPEFEQTRRCVVRKDRPPVAITRYPVSAKHNFTGDCLRSRHGLRIN